MSNDYHEQDNNHSNQGGDVMIMRKRMTMVAIIIYSKSWQISFLPEVIVIFLGDFRS